MKTARVLLALSLVRQFDLSFSHSFPFIMGMNIDLSISLKERGDATIRLEGTQEKLLSVEAPRVEPTFGEDHEGTALKMELSAADEIRLQSELDRVDKEEKVDEWIPPGYDMKWLQPKSKLKEFALAAVAVGRIGGAGKKGYGAEQKKRKKKFH